MEFSNAPRTAVTADRFLASETAVGAVLLGLAGIFVLQLHLDWTLNPSYNYGWLVPFLAAYSFWMRWSRRLTAQRPSPHTAALALLALCAALLFPLRVVAKANPDWRLISWGVGLTLATVALSLFWLTGGARRARHLAFPVLFCLVAIPWPTQFEQAVVHRLMQLVAAINVNLLTVAGVAALRHGSVIELANGVLGVEDACSGIRSLQSTFMLSLFLGEFYLLTPLKRVALVLLGALLAFFCNIARTFFLAWVAHRDGIPAIEHWHDTAGWVVIFACLAGLWLACLWLENSGTEARPPAPAAAVRFPLLPLGVLGAWLLFVEGGSELWYRARQKDAPPAPAWTVAWPKGDHFEAIPIPPAAADLLHYNEGRAVSWRDAEGQRWNLFFFKWLPGRTAALSVKIHRPEICLPASGFTAVGAARSKLLEVNGVSLPTRAYRFRDGNTPLHVYYCYWDGTVFRDTAEMIEEDWTLRGRLKRVWTGRRDRGAQTLEVAVWGEQEDAAADEALRRQLSEFIQKTG